LAAIVPRQLGGGGLPGRRVTGDNHLDPRTPWWPRRMSRPRSAQEERRQRAAGSCRLGRRIVVIAVPKPLRLSCRYNSRRPGHRDRRWWCRFLPGGRNARSIAARPPRCLADDVVSSFPTRSGGDEAGMALPGCPSDPSAAQAPITGPRGPPVRNFQHRKCGSPICPCWGRSHRPPHLDPP